ncbi:MAG: hypothetical protein ABFS39_13000 [Pseudomonadota bacterium]
MSNRTGSFILRVLFLVFSSLVFAQVETNTCLSCHPYQASEFSPAHGFATSSCFSCHLGDQDASDLPQAHENLIAKPGDLHKDRTICAACHPRQAGNVLNSLMNSGKGLVQKTRQALGEGDHPEIEAGLESLGDSPADSMLRKLCARCHLAHASTHPVADATQARGGGCSACHINQREEKRHPHLTAKVEDARCFGCHSRSGRISLNYVGLAEADPDPAKSKVELLRLTDGRTVMQHANDIHHQAGMSCIDCHTSTGLMGGGDNSGFKHQAVDIECGDCHLASVTQASRDEWPDSYAEMQRYLEPNNQPDRKVPLTRRYGTPLWHIEIRDDGSRLLTPKLGGPALSIPDYKIKEHPNQEQHTRLTCSACHTQWAPLCYGCHSSYDPAGKQWDHLRRQETAGRWTEIRWDVRAELPPLGVDGQNQIRPVSPGMIMQVDHPAWESTLFKRLFALSEPHTSGPSRSCESCHRNSSALGLGQGNLSRKNGKWVFRPARKNLQDGLPADAWTSLDGRLKGESSGDHIRPFSKEEIQAILNAQIDR